MVRSSSTGMKEDNFTALIHSRIIRSMRVHYRPVHLERIPRALSARRQLALSCGQYRRHDSLERVVERCAGGRQSPQRGGRRIVDALSGVALQSLGKPITQGLTAKVYSGTRHASSSSFATGGRLPRWHTQRASLVRCTPLDCSSPLWATSWRSTAVAACSMRV
jgi:hypothetical protein